MPERMNPYLGPTPTYSCLRDPTVKSTHNSSGSRLLGLLSLVVVVSPLEKRTGCPAPTHTLRTVTSTRSQSWKGPREIYLLSLHFSLYIRHGWLRIPIVDDKFLHKESLDTRT